MESVYTFSLWLTVIVLAGAFSNEKVIKYFFSDVSSYPFHHPVHSPQLRHIVDWKLIIKHSVLFLLSHHDLLLSKQSVELDRPGEQSADVVAFRGSSLFKELKQAKCSKSSKCYCRLSGAISHYQKLIWSVKWMRYGSVKMMSHHLWHNCFESNWYHQKVTFL